MAKIKFDPSATPLNKEHYGFTFQRNNYGFSMFPAGKNDRKRYPLQWEKMQFMSKAIRNWRNMSAATKNAWNVFSTTYPQPTEKDPNVFLTGYQLFLKRNFYRFLHEGIDFDFMLLPELAELPTPDFSIEILEDGMCVDVTEEYIRNHGILPEIGQFVICRVIPMAVESGQFFAPFVATLEVQEVYIDGLVCSFNFPNIVENIVFSLYMSKPVYESVQYAGTKFRYMGCFKPTKFIQLTDTPDSYEGEAGKIVKVKDDETGLEFSEGSGCEICPPVPGEGDAGKVIQVNPTGDGYELAEGGGGGFDCADLLDCGVIQQILNAIGTISDEIVDTPGTAIPPVKVGYYYNFSAANDPRLPAANSGFVLPSEAHWQDLGNQNGGHSNASNVLKDTNLLYWDPANTNTNLAEFFARGGGEIQGSTGNSRNWGIVGSYWSSTISIFPNAIRFLYFLYNTNKMNFSGADSRFGFNIRLCNPNTSLSDGQKGTYIGTNGTIYPTKCYGSIEWMTVNLKETHFSDGTEIPLYPANYFPQGFEVIRRGNYANNPDNA